MRPLRSSRRLFRDEAGTIVVELAFVIPLFLLLIFGLLDFGRLAYNWVMAEKAVQMAARMAAVRPPVCTAVPDTNLAGSGNTGKYGLPCSRTDTVCKGEGTTPIQCLGSLTVPTSTAIWNAVGPLMPGNATAANLRFIYSYDPAMNFLGGPYVPVVTVELRNLQFDFVSPLLDLARLAGATPNGTGNITFPPMSVSLPGEDLALGEAG